MSTFDPRWLTSDVVGLASSVYDGGPAAFSRLPVLADALEDAGCDDELLLTRCRASGPRALVPILLCVPPADVRITHINKWLDEDRSLWQVRLMLSDWYCMMPFWSLKDYSEAYAWLGEAARWPDGNGWYWIECGLSRIDQSVLPINDSSYIYEIAQSCDLWRYNKTRQEHENAFIVFWSRLNYEQRDEMWRKIGKRFDGVRNDRS